MWWARPRDAARTAVAAIVKGLNDNTSSSNSDEGVRREGTGLPLPPPVRGSDSDADTIRPTAPTASQFTDRASGLSVTSDSTIVAPELESVPSTGSAPPYWRSYEKGQAAASEEGFPVGYVDR